MLLNVLLCIFWITTYCEKILSILSKKEQNCVFLNDITPHPVHPTALEAGYLQLHEIQQGI